MSLLFRPRLDYCWLPERRGRPWAVIDAVCAAHAALRQDRPGARRGGCRRAPGRPGASGRWQDADRRGRSRAAGRPRDRRRRLSADADRSQRGVSENRKPQQPPGRQPTAPTPLRRGRLRRIGAHGTLGTRRPAERLSLRVNANWRAQLICSCCCYCACPSASTSVSEIVGAQRRAPY